VDGGVRPPPWPLPGGLISEGVSRDGVRRLVLWGLLSLQAAGAAYAQALQMLQFTAAGGGPRLMFIVHHHDAGREYAYYDRKSSIGRLYEALRRGEREGTVVSMKQDWKKIFAFE
jgi:hypothetical protein